MRDAWRRAQAWAPEFVAADLHAARELAEEYRRDAVIWRAGLDRHPVGSPEREMDERDVAAAEHLAAVSAARVEALERIQAVRTDWLDRTREVQERAAFAGDELERRGLDRDTAAPVGEQQELFAIPDDEPTPSEADAGVDAAATPATRCAAWIPRSSSSTSTRCRAPFPAACHRARGAAHTTRCHRGPGGRASEAPRMTRSARPPRRPGARPRPRGPAVPTARPTATPSCSPRPNVRPSASVSSPLCSTHNPPRPTSPPRSRCTLDACHFAEELSGADRRYRSGAPA